VDLAPCDAKNIHTLTEGYLLLFRFRMTTAVLAVVIFSLTLFACHLFTRSRLELTPHSLQAG
jgi:hypothetical protein